MFAAVASQHDGGGGPGKYIALSTSGGGSIFSQSAHTPPGKKTNAKTKIDNQAILGSAELVLIFIPPFSVKFRPAQPTDNKFASRELENQRFYPSDLAGFNK
jgi:hypothetical protein